MAPRRFFVAANWKMNGSSKSLTKLAQALNDASLDSNTEVVIAPPTIYLLAMRDTFSKGIELSGQNCYIDKEGAFTGEVSPWQLAEEHIPWVILGHSERRHVFREINTEIADKTAAALEFGVKVMLCVGEQLEEREKGKTLDVIEEQLRVVVEKKPDWSKIVIAYEPVWAIGTGKVATPEQAQEVHADIRKYLADAVGKDVAESTRILYGGSVNAKNCRELSTQGDIDGFLVGGASLKPEFVDIINARSAQAPLTLPHAQLRLSTENAKL